MLPVAFETEFLEIQGCSLNAACLESFSSLSIPHRIRWNYSLSSVTQSCLTATPWTAARQASLSVTNSRSLLKLMSIESVMPSSHLILCRPFSSCPQSFPASGSFPVTQFFASSGPSVVLLFYAVAPPAATDTLPSRIPNPDSLLPSFGPLTWPLCPLQPSLSNQTWSLPSP